MSNLELEQNLQGICKDCGHGTLNNSIVVAFVVEFDDYDVPQISCTRCGSYHVDAVLL